MNLKDIRRLNLLLLQRTEFGNLASQLAKQIKRAPSQVSQWYMGYRTISEETARDIEDKCQKPPGWLDVLRTDMWTPDSKEGAASASGSGAAVLVREPVLSAPSSPPGRAWPHTALTAWQWHGLTEDERMQLEAAMLQAYAVVMRHRRERQEQQQQQAVDHQPPQANIRQA